VVGGVFLFFAGGVEKVPESEVLDKSTGEVL
jgi:hypothetical protein